MTELTKEEIAELRKRSYLTGDHVPDLLDTIASLDATIEARDKRIKELEEDLFYLNKG